MIFNLAFWGLIRSQVSRKLTTSEFETVFTLVLSFSKGFLRVDHVVLDTDRLAYLNIVYLSGDD